jgi:glycosidase
VDIDHGEFDKFEEGTWKLSDLKRLFNEWQTFMYDNDGWNALYWENHDQPRSIDRYTNAKPENSTIAGKLLATCLALMSGTPFVYQGQEIGMRNVPIEWPIEEYQDIDCVNHWKRYVYLFPSSEISY